VYIIGLVWCSAILVYLSLVSYLVDTSPPKPAYTKKHLNCWFSEQNCVYLSSLSHLPSPLPNISHLRWMVQTFIRRNDIFLLKKRCSVDHNYGCLLIRQARNHCLDKAYSGCYAKCLHSSTIHRCDRSVLSSPWRKKFYFPCDCTATPLVVDESVWSTSSSDWLHCWWNVSLYIKNTVNEQSSYMSKTSGYTENWNALSRP